MRSSIKMEFYYECDNCKKEFQRHKSLPGAYFLRLNFCTYKCLLIKNRSRTLIVSLIPLIFSLLIAIYSKSIVNSIPLFAIGILGLIFYSTGTYFKLSE